MLLENINLFAKDHGSYSMQSKYPTNVVGSIQYFVGLRANGPGDYNIIVEILEMYESSVGWKHSDSESCPRLVM